MTTYPAHALTRTLRPPSQADLEKALGAGRTRRVAVWRTLYAALRAAVVSGAIPTLYVLEDGRSVLVAATYTAGDTSVLLRGRAGMDEEGVRKLLGCIPERIIEPVRLAAGALKTHVVEVALGIGRGDRDPDPIEKSWTVTDEEVAEAQQPAATMAGLNARRQVDEWWEKREGEAS